MTALAEPDTTASETESWALGIIPKVRARRPHTFRTRIAYWRSGAGSSWLSEFVSSTSELTIPVDRMGNVKDRLDRQMQLALRDYNACAADIERLLGTMAGLEEKWLFDIATATQQMREVAEDGEACEGCGQTRSQYEFKKPKTPWTKRRGLATCCHQKWLDWGQPDLLVFRARIKEQRGT